MALSILWITDEWATLDHERDTTLRLIEEALKGKCECFWADGSSLHVVRGEVLLDAAPVLSVTAGRRAEDFCFGSKTEISPTAFGVVMLRPDPPLDEIYHGRIRMLSTALRKCRATEMPEMINSIPTVLGVNSKSESLLIPEFLPESIVSAEWSALAEFGKVWKTTVIKPINRSQCNGVEMIRWDNPAAVVYAHRALEAATFNFRKAIVLQVCLPRSYGPEVRHWYVDGELVACAEKMFPPGVSSLDVKTSYKIIPHKPDDVGKCMSEQIGQHLKLHRIRTAAIDTIGRFIIDFNIVSPGLLCEMEHAYHTNFAVEVVDRLFIRR